MALDNFTLTVNPFTGAQLGNGGGVNGEYFIDADRGSDTNIGSRDLPFKSLAKISNAANNSIFILRGTFQETLTINVNAQRNYMILGDLNTRWAGAVTLFYIDITPDSSIRMANIEGDLLSIVSQGNAASKISRTFFRNCLFASVTIAGYNNSEMSKVNIILNTFGLFAGYIEQQGIISDSMTFSTINTISITGFNQSSISNCIIAGGVNFTPNAEAYAGMSAKMTNCIIRKQAVWSFNNIIIPIDWNSGDSDIESVINSVVAFADTGSVQAQNKQALKSAVVNLFGSGTIIYDDSAPNVRLFNAYASDGITPKDYSLNLQEGNPALTNSSFESYVGAYRPKINIAFGDADIINNDGIVTSVGNGDLLAIDSVTGDITINTSSTQARNKMETSGNVAPYQNNGVISMPSGDRFTQLQSLFSPSNSAVLYLGPKQDLTGGLSPINAVVIEPYDTPTTPSAWPKFCAPINKEVQIAYHLAGPKEGLPVLFNDLAGLGITHNLNPAEVGTWAVTNAVDIWDEVITHNDVTSRGTLFRHFKVILIGNRIE